MAIDTQDERHASLTFGMPGSAGVRVPGSSTAFRRGAALGLWNSGGTDVAIVTKRLILVGTSQKRLTTVGTSQKRLTLIGASQ